MKPDMSQDYEGMTHDFPVLEKKQRESLLNLLSPVDNPSKMSYAALTELLYTASVTGVLDYDSISVDEAILIWKLIEISKTISQEDLNKITM